MNGPTKQTTPTGSNRFLKTIMKKNHFFFRITFGKLIFYLNLSNNGFNCSRRDPVIITATFPS